DVSPQNILVANNGTTMIIDFGVAKARDRLSQETSAGQLKGKIRYMAPEQALGRPVDHRADIWALGAMLYEMFTGAPPYDGPNEVATLHKLTSGQRPAPVPATMPEVLRSVVQRALGYEPDERFSSALELNLALENAMVQINEPTSPAVVSAYTGNLLQDRKAARKDAVDAALEKARKRDDKRAASAQALASGSSSESGVVSSPGVSSSSGTSPSAASASSNLRSAQQNETPSVPSRAAERLSLNETPSSATLGSANMEYFPDPGLDESRKRRYITAAVLGVSVAAAVIGLVLIITTVVPEKRSRLSEEPPLATSVTAPTPPTNTSATISPPSTPATVTTASTSTATTASTPATSTTSTPSPSTTGGTHSGSARRGDGPPSKPTVAPTFHRPPPQPTQPTPPPKPTGPDRGF
ncbi:MAG TPA: serine/threonine-protein kinase, partial [Labilithrix sp.]|nr:serine/threonine-protein kinase [Labilithrix sp.]